MSKANQTEQAAFVPVIKKLVTLPLLKLAAGAPPVYFKPVEAIFIGKEVAAGPGGKPMEPAHICRGVNLMTGELCEIICPTVLQSIWHENYPGADYVGKGFMIELIKVEGKKYHQVKLAELEL